MIICRCCCSFTRFWIYFSSLYVSVFALMSDFFICMQAPSIDIKQTWPDHVLCMYTLTQTHTHAFMEWFYVLWGDVQFSHLNVNKKTKHYLLLIERLSHTELCTHWRALFLLVICYFYRRTTFFFRRCVVFSSLVSFALVEHHGMSESVKYSMKVIGLNVWGEWVEVRGEVGRCQTA